MINRKAKGNRNEYRTMDYLKEKGYKVTRAAASLGEWDVIAISATDVQLVQVKSNRWPRSDEMKKLNAFPCPKYVRRVLHRWDDWVSEPKIRIL